MVFQEVKKADELAKLGAKGGQQDNSVTFREKKTLIRAALGQCSERDDFHFLDRWQQVVVMKLRTGHNRLNAHMFKNNEAGTITNLQLRS